MTRYTGVILDVDGVLVDSNDAHARCWVKAFAEQGMDVPFETVRPLIGMGGDQLIPTVVGVDREDPRYERIKDAWKRHFQDDEMPHLQPFQGNRALIENLRRRGLRVVAGTSADQALIEGLLKIAGVQDLLTEYTTATDVQESKPQPDIILAALKKLQLPPGETLMVGDTPYDIEAARRADVDTVALRCGGDDRFDGAVAVYDDPADLSAHLGDLLAPR